MQSLVQDINTKMIKEMNCVNVTAKPTEAQLKDMEFGMRVVKFVKSMLFVSLKMVLLLAAGRNKHQEFQALEMRLSHKDKAF